jgi:hypothetical protein
MSAPDVAVLARGIERSFAELQQGHARPSV